MKFSCYSHWPLLPTGVDALFAQAEQDSIFYSRTWFDVVTAALPDDHTLLLACVTDQQRIRALMPLVQDAGNTLYALAHRYTPHYSLLIDNANNDYDRVLTCLVAGLRERAPRALLLEPVAGEDNHLGALQRRLSAVGFRCEHAFRQYNWFYRVQGRSFDAYMAQRPARLRNTIARKQRKLQREQGYEIRLHLGDEAPAAMADYYAAFNASWKANEQYTGFMNQLVAAFSQRGWTRLAVMYVQKKPIAAQLWFVRHGKASIFRLAYDQDWKRYSPGSILMHYLMEYVIESDRVTEIDFLMGNDAYKQDWMSERRERLALSCINQVKSPRASSGGLGRMVAPLKRLLQRA